MIDDQKSRRRAWRMSTSLVTTKKAHGGQKWYTCEMCREVYNSNRFRLMLRKSHDSKNPSVCVVCNKTFRNSHLMKKHAKLHCRYVGPNGRVVCDDSFCKRFTQVTRLKDQGRTNIVSGNVDNTYAGELCAPVFVNCSLLKEHAILRYKHSQTQLVGSTPEGGGDFGRSNYNFKNISATLVVVNTDPAITFSASTRILFRRFFVRRGSRIKSRG